MLLIFFAAVILLEIACLVVLYLAYRWVIQQQARVSYWVSALPAVTTEFSTALKSGKVTLHQILWGLERLEMLFPWWLKALLSVFRCWIPAKSQTG